MWELFMAGTVRSVRVSVNPNAAFQRRLVPVAALEEYLESLSQEQATLRSRRHNFPTGLRNRRALVEEGSRRSLCDARPRERAISSLNRFGIVCKTQGDASWSGTRTCRC